MIARQRTVRPAFTLIEMIVVLWTAGIAMTLGVLLINALLKTDRAATQAATRLVNMADIATVFRADVAHATARTDAGVANLLLTVPTGRIEYQIRENGVERLEQPAGHRRHLPLGKAGLKVEFLPTLRGVVTLRITEPLPVGPPRIVEIAAALGGDQR